jgi:hypothetical protein
MPVTDYVEAKKAGTDGLDTFMANLQEKVIRRDENYYQPILRCLLPEAGCNPGFCCLTDLCKASFVRMGDGPDKGNRGDEGSDAVVKKNWRQWLPYVAGLPNGGADTPLSYQWLWLRMQRCRVIIALGTIAEYGLLKIFLRMAADPKAWSWGDATVMPDHPTMTAQVSNWEYGYACSQRAIAKWLGQEDWWNRPGTGTCTLNPCSVDHGRNRSV